MALPAGRRGIRADLVRSDGTIGDLTDVKEDLTDVKEDLTDVKEDLTDVKEDLTYLHNMVYATNAISQFIGETQAQNSIVVGYISNLSLPVGAVVIGVVNESVGGGAFYDAGQYNISGNNILYTPTFAQQNVTCTYRVLFMIPHD